MTLKRKCLRFRDNLDKLQMALAGVIKLESAMKTHRNPVSHSCEMLQRVFEHNPRMKL